MVIKITPAELIEVISLQRDLLLKMTDAPRNKVKIPR